MGVLTSVPAIEARADTKKGRQALLGTGDGALPPKQLRPLRFHAEFT